MSPPVDNKSLSRILGTECLPCLQFVPLPPLGGKGSKFLPIGSFGGRGIEFFIDVSDLKFGGVLLLGGKGSRLSFGGSGLSFGGSGGGTSFGGNAGGGVLVLSSSGDCDASAVKFSSSSLA